LRLAVVSPFIDRRHGTERALAELLERLARTEHCEVHLYAQRVEDLALDQPGVRRAQGSGGIFWHKVPSTPGPHLSKFILWLFLNSVCRAWDRRVHGLHFDLVLSPGINCFDADVIIVHVLFHRLQELARRGHDETTPLGFFRRLHRGAYYALLTWMEQRIYADPAVSLAAVSSRTAKLLADAFHRTEIRIIPNGVDTAQFSPPGRLTHRAGSRQRRNLGEQDFVLLLIGNDWRAKGLETILRAMSTLREFPISLIAAGNDSPGSFREMAIYLGVAHRCRFEPSRQDVLDFYAAADLYVSPSREDSFGLPVAEAMACGLPAITSSLAGVSSLLHDGVDSLILRDPHDAKTLATMIRTLYQNAEWRNRMGQAAAKTSLEWNWDRNAAELWELLKDTAARRASPAARKN
jgi:UDP-glucose:(heptosyl)LPS alpha-1,3-glucosyltransferase